MDKARTKYEIIQKTLANKKNTMSISKLCELAKMIAFYIQIKVFTTHQISTFNCLKQRTFKGLRHAVEIAGTMLSKNLFLVILKMKFLRKLKGAMTLLRLRK